MSCDIVTHLYGYSFYLNPRWSKGYASGEEIEHYLKDVVKNFNLQDHMRFNRTVSKIEWGENDKQQHITVKSKDGSTKNYR